MPTEQKLQYIESAIQIYPELELKALITAEQKGASCIPKLTAVQQRGLEIASTGQINRRSPTAHVGVSFPR